MPENTVPFYQTHEDIRSFLYDPFGDDPPSAYGLELTAAERIEARFFTKAASRLEAIKLGYAWLSNLQFKFRGLDGSVEAKPITQKNRDPGKELHLLEVILPQGFIKTKVNIIVRFKPPENN